MKTLQRSLLIVGFSLVFAVSAMAGETQGPSDICIPGESNGPPCSPPPPQEMSAGSAFDLAFDVDSASMILIGSLRELIF